MPARPQQIVKTSGRIAPGMSDYRTSRHDFSWDVARGWLDGAPPGGLLKARELGLPEGETSTLEPYA